MQLITALSSIDLTFLLMCTSISLTSNMTLHPYNLYISPFNGVIPATQECKTRLSFAWPLLLTKAQGLK